MKRLKRLLKHQSASEEQILNALNEYLLKHGIKNEQLSRELLEIFGGTIE